MFASEKKVILVVEDELPLSDAIRLKLERHGFEVVTARTVEQATGYLSDLPTVDAVWLDHYLLGKESGLEFVSYCKDESSRHRSLPIFVVSNTATPEKIQAYMRLGVEKYYVKSNMRLETIVEEISTSLDESEAG